MKRKKLLFMQLYLKYRVHVFRVLTIELSAIISRSHVIALSERNDQREYEALIMS